jgi:hypothetical protein
MKIQPAVLRCCLRETWKLLSKGAELLQPRQAIPSGSEPHHVEALLIGRKKTSSRKHERAGPGAITWKRKRIAPALGRGYPTPVARLYRGDGARHLAKSIPIP